MNDFIVALGLALAIEGFIYAAFPGEMQRMLETIRDRVRAAINEGKSLEEAQGAGLTSEYDERWESERRIGSSAALIEAAYLDMGKE